MMHRVRGNLLRPIALAILLLLLAGSWFVLRQFGPNSGTPFDQNQQSEGGLKTTPSSGSSKALSGDRSRYSVRPGLLDEFPSALPERLAAIEASVPASKIEDYYIAAIVACKRSELPHLFAWHANLNPGEKRFRLVEFIARTAVHQSALEELDSWIDDLVFPEERIRLNEALTTEFRNLRAPRMSVIHSPDRFSSYLRSKAIEAIVTNDISLNGEDFLDLWNQPDANQEQILVTSIPGMVNGNGGSGDAIWRLAQDLPPANRSAVASALIQSRLLPTTVTIEELRAAVDNPPSLP